MLRSVVLTVWLVCAATAFAAPPRYRFTPGQELHFTGKKTTWHKEKPTEGKVSWRLWVLDANPDGSWNVLTEAEDEDDQKYLVEVTIHPDGRIPWNTTMERLPAWLSVRRLLPMLPTDEELAKSQWSVTEPRTAMRWDYRCERNREALVISAECRGPLELVSEGSMEFTWTFDLKNGAITGCDSKGAWADYKERLEESLALSAPGAQDAEPLASLRAEAQRYFQTVAEYRARFTPHDWARLIHKTATTPIDVQEDEGRALLEAAAERTRHPTIREHFAKLLKDHEQRGKWVKSSLEEYAKLLDKSSPEWSAEDLAGKTHRLADYQGKVVVLDFWFRKCNYCIRAQPQLDAVIEHFQDQPVVFLGMNVDEEIADARFAVAQLRTAYPTLQAKAVQEQYGFSGAPIWLILDRKGIVRSINVGYSGRLQEELTESISALLK